jgi:hypothetical protein
MDRSAMTTLRWKGEGAFQDEVVGESHYQAALKKLAHGEKRRREIACLIPEQNNKYDANAVRVEIGGNTVGHLPQDRAKLHRERLARLNQQSAIVECDAVIVTGSQGISGVYLDLPFTVRGDGTARSTDEALKPADSTASDMTTTKSEVVPSGRRKIPALPVKWAAILLIGAMIVCVLGALINNFDLATVAVLVGGAVAIYWVVSAITRRR